MTPDDLARYLAGELSADDHRRVARWLHANPDMRAVLEGIAGSEPPDVEAALTRLRAAASTEELSRPIKRGFPEATSSASEQQPFAGAIVSQRRRQARPPVPSKAVSHRFSPTARRFAGGASLIVAVAALFLWIDGQEASPVTFTADTGSRRTVELEDGTTVTLNVASRLIVHPDFGERGREVVLEGEAYFDVERAPDLPFIVEAGAATVTVLGTSFNVDGYAADRITVVVGEGRVRMREPSGLAVELGPGERGRLETIGGGIAVGRGSIDEAIAWMNHRMVFRAAPMEEVAGRLEREFDVDVEIPEYLAGRRLDASFEVHSIEEIAPLIAAALDIEVSIEDDRVRFSSEEGRE